jgi:stearoyl-CoA 9-desaturase NADPH oxidoreductase
MRQRSRLVDRRALNLYGAHVFTELLRPLDRPAPTGHLGRIGRQAGNRLVGLLEAATTPHGLDGYTELLDPTWSRRECRARVVDVARQTPDSVTLRLAPNRQWRGFVAGQHVELSVEIDGVRQTRCYSPAGSQHDRSTIELTVKAHPGGVVSEHLHRNAAVGQVVTVSPAAGEFVLPDRRPSRLLLVSGGSGITPVMAMLRTLLDENHAGEVTFLHYALTSDRMIYRDELDRLAAHRAGVRVVRVFTDQPGRGDLDGFLTAEHLEAAHPGWADTRTYVCGPAPLMEAAGRLFAEAGRAHRLHTESFTFPGTVPGTPPGTLPQLGAEAGACGGTLRFAASGVEVPNDGRTLLEQAESAGLRPAYGCRRGICHTCTRTLEAGTVRHVVTGAVSADPGTPVQLCVNVPTGDVTIDLRGSA